MTIDLEHVRSRNPIEDVITEKFALKKSGSRFIGVDHDSMVVVPTSGMYFWNSRGEHGDVFDFVGRYHLNYGSGWNNRDPQHFMEAVEHLARRAGISIERGADFRQTAAWSERQLVQRLHDTLLNTPPALSYATKMRGWDIQTIRLARLGFMPSDKRPLLEGLNLSDSWRNVIQKFPAGMLVYVHLDKGRLTYLSGRSIEGKKHYNPPRDLIGEKQPYRNHLYHGEVESVVLVEGQADAITFGMWGIPAVAIAGMTVNDTLLEMLKRHRRVFIALDNTDEARVKAFEIARQLPDRAHIPQLPEGVKDASEWLSQHGASAEDAAYLLNTAPSWIALEIDRVGDLEGIERQDAVRQLFTHAVRLDDFAFAEFKTAVGKIGIKGRAFTDLAKATRSEVEEQEEDDVPQILSDDIPLLSPALGFRRDVAMVTVSITERTKGNKLNIQPYLVTSTRELRRLSLMVMICSSDRRRSSRGLVTR